MIFQSKLAILVLEKPDLVGLALRERRRADKRSAIRRPVPRGGGWRCAYPPYGQWRGRSASDA